MLHKLSNLGIMGASDPTTAAAIGLGASGAALGGNLLASSTSGTSNILKALLSTGIGANLGGIGGAFAGHMIGNRLTPALADHLPIAGGIAGAGLGGYLARRHLDEYDTAEERDRMKKASFEDEHGISDKPCKKTNPKRDYRRIKSAAFAEAIWT